MTDYSEYEENEFITGFDGKTFIRILEQIKPHWIWVTGFLVLIAWVSFMDSYFTFLSKQIVDYGIGTHNITVLKNIIFVYGLLIIVQACAVFGFIYLVGLLGERVRYDLRQKMFDHIQNLSLTYFNSTPVGWIMSRLTSDSDRVAELVTWGLLDTTWALMNILTAIVFMLIINWRLALIVALTIPILIIVAAQFQKRIIREFRSVRKINAKITGSYNENITGVRVVKALGREKQNLNEFSRLSGDMYRASYRAAWLSALLLPSVQIISAIALGSVIWYGGMQAQIGLMTIGGIQAFVSYITFMMWPIQDLARVYAELQHAIASAERIFSLIDSKPDIVDKEGALDPGTLQGDIQFIDISFNYSDGDDILDGFNLHVKQGETIALVGPTGGGKTTIVNLLCRFFQPTKGSILINGFDYLDLSLHAIQSRIGMVLQTPHLFSGTIRDNIRYGRLNATNEEIELAARLSGAHAFIETMDNGYDVNVGEGGNLLSVGQKQLISLARAILSEPDIFIMDEATSSVDTLTERMIQEGIESLLKQATSFIIAHRLSTIKSADRILVIKDGKIFEQGTHNELLKLKGHYYQLYTNQFRKEMEKEYDPLQLLGMNV